MTYILNKHLNQCHVKIDNIFLFLQVMSLETEIENSPVKKYRTVSLKDNIGKVCSLMTFHGNTSTCEYPL